jgi:hypothetical protein
MIIPSQPLPLPPAQTAQPTTPHNNAALATAAVAAQKLAKPTETQTKRAASAVAQADRGREDQDGTHQGYAYDTEAATVQAKANHQPPRDRGGKLDVSV